MCFTSVRVLAMITTFFKVTLVTLVSMFTTVIIVPIVRMKAGKVKVSNKQAQKLWTHANTEAGPFKA